jgi:predicted Co/Zn/Cd cation transporter (cation efflux family)
VVTLAGFALVWLLPEPWAQWWARYADSAVLALLALLLLPVPAKILVDNMREVLRMANPDDEVSQRVQAAMRVAAQQYDIATYSTHIAKTGRIYVVEINIVVGEEFELRSVPELDTLRGRIWDAIGLPLEQAWLGILFTADPRWS